MEKCSISTEYFHLTPPTQFHFRPSRFQGGPALPESNVPDANPLSAQLVSSLPLLSAKYSVCPVRLNMEDPANDQFTLMLPLPEIHI